MHAAQTSKEEREKRSRRQETRESQLSHLQQDIGGPGSPSMATQSNAEDSMNQLTVSMSSTSSAQDLPPDTQKFLSFAERHRTVLNQVTYSWKTSFEALTLMSLIEIPDSAPIDNPLGRWPLLSPRGSHPRPGFRRQAAILQNGVGTGRRRHQARGLGCSCQARARI